MEEKKNKENKKNSMRPDGNKKISKDKQKEIAIFYDQMSIDPFPYGGEFND